MSRKALEELIGRMVLDAEFRKQVQRDPQKATAGFDLTPGEREGLKHIDIADFDKTVTGLDGCVTHSAGCNCVVRVQ